MHNTTLPFTRMLAGPMDYTPGAFGNSNRENFVARNFMPMGLDTRRTSWRLYVVLESPLQMVSDYPEHYAGQHDFEFIKQVPTTWDEVRVLEGTPHENSSRLARRSGRTGTSARSRIGTRATVKVPLSFLGEGKYIAEIYADAPDAAVEATHTHFRNSRSTRARCWTSEWFQAAETRSGFIRNGEPRRSLRGSARFAGSGDSRTGKFQTGKFQLRSSASD